MGRGGAGRPRPNGAFRHCDRPPGRRRCGRDRGRTAATGSRVRRASSSRRPRGCRVSHRLAWRDAAQRPDPGPRRRPSDRAAGSFGHGAVDRTIPAAGQRHPEAARGVRADADRAAGPESGRGAGSRPDAARRRLGADVAAPAPTPPPHGPRPRHVGRACQTRLSGRRISRGRGRSRSSRPAFPGAPGPRRRWRGRAGCRARPSHPRRRSCPRNPPCR